MNRPIVLVGNFKNAPAIATKETGIHGNVKNNGRMSDAKGELVILCRKFPNPCLLRMGRMSPRKNDPMANEINPVRSKAI